MELCEYWVRNDILDNATLYGYRHICDCPWFWGEENENHKYDFSGMTGVIAFASQWTVLEHHHKPSLDHTCMENVK